MSRKASHREPRLSEGRPAGASSAGAPEGAAGASRREQEEFSMWTQPRGGPRADVNLEVQFRSAEDFVAAYAKKISGGGLFIQTATPLALNQAVHLRFTLPGMAEPFELKGLVVWTNPFASQAAFPTGMGIKFLELEPHQRTIIDDFVRTQLAEAPSGA